MSRQAPIDPTPGAPSAPPDYASLDIPPEGSSGPITREEAEFLHALVARLKPKATLEVGMGYGVSASFIISAARAPHYAMDPFQLEYRDQGLKNVAKLGLDRHLQFLREHSHSALPRLLDQGVKVDFAFIDGGHRFDDIFIDFYYCELLLNEGGHVVLHDAWMRSTQTVAAWVRRNKRNFEAVPVPIRNLILFRKRGDDDRAWNHFRGFGTWKGLVSHSWNTFKRKLRAVAGR